LERDENPQIAELRVANALEKIENTLQNTWMLIAKVFIILISILIIVMLTAFFFLKQHQIKPHVQPKHRAKSETDKE